MEGVLYARTARRHVSQPVEADLVTRVAVIAFQLWQNHSVSDC
jgi:hypothetical protein